MELKIMNKKNNRRAKETDERIIRAVYDAVMGGKKLSRVTVSEICEAADINRSTFYAHFMDVYDVLEKTEAAMSKLFTERFVERLDDGGTLRECFVDMFAFVSEYREFYRIYLNETAENGVIGVAWDLFSDRLEGIKPGDFYAESGEELVYRGTFFLYGLSAVIRMWVNGGCKESPEEMVWMIERNFDPKLGGMFEEW